MLIFNVNKINNNSVIDGLFFSYCLVIDYILMNTAVKAIKNFYART